MRLSLLLSLSVLTGTVFAQAESKPFDSYIPVDDNILQEPAPEDWLMWRRTLNAWGHSPLTQISPANVSELELVWSAEMEPGGLQEGTPLVYDGILFMPNPGDVIQALDAASGKLLWEYRRQMPEDLGDYIQAAKTNRNLAIYGDNILYTSNDDYLVALDVRSGKLRWETKILDYRVNPAQQSSGPIIIKGMAVSGRGCMPQAGPEACVITAHDASSGAEMWRFHTIEKPGGKDDSWGGLPWESRWHVGAWMAPSYDPELDTIYMGTSVTAPSPKFLLAGNDKTYLYHNSTLALAPDSGELKWYYQHLVDHWDLDHPFERLLVDTRVVPDAGEVAWINPDIDPNKEYKVMTGIPGKTGVVYTLDRETGEFLWARPTIHQTVLESIDGKTGAAKVNPAMAYQEISQAIEVCPAATGGKNWQAGTYSPLTRAMYYSLHNSCSDTVVTMEEPDPEGLYGIFGRDKIRPGTENLGSLYAISAETGELLWKYEQRGSLLSLVSTGGGLIFGGDIEGKFRAFDQRSGEVLWETALGSTVTGYPVSFGVKGRQYIAVSTGSSVTTSTQRLFLPEIEVGSDNRLYIFALPE